MKFYIALLFALCCTSYEALADAGGEARHFSTYDGITAKLVSGPISVSPDRRYCYFIEYQSDIVNDKVDYILKIFDMLEIRHSIERGESAPPPISVIRMATKSNNDAITRPHWADGGNSIVFLGANDQMEGSNRAIYHVYRLDIERNRITKVSNGLGEVHAGIVTGIHSVAPSSSFQVGGATIAFAANVNAPQSLHTDPKYPATYLSTEQFKDAIIRRPPFIETHGYFVSYPGRPLWRMGPLMTVPGGDYTWKYNYWLSPTGQYFIAQMPLEMVAAMGLPGGKSEYTSPDENRPMFKLVLIDADSGKMRPLTESAPYRKRPFESMKVLWGLDGHHAIAVSTATPIGAAIDNPALDKLYVVDFDIRSKSSSIIDKFEIDIENEDAPSFLTVDISWSEPNTVLRLTQKRGRYWRSDAEVGISSIYSRVDGRWREHSGLLQDVVDNYDRDWVGVTDKLDNVAMSVIEGPFTPPRVIASLGQKTMALTESRTSQRSVRMSTMTKFEWLDKDGRQYTGGLILPPQRHVSTLPRPLVVQIMDGDLFSVDKFGSAGAERIAVYAAQELARRGMIVLQFDCNVPIGTSNEARTVVGAIDAAVEFLSAKGIVDSARVGLVGHSRMGYYVDYAITNPGHTAFAAALSNEGATASYVYYLMYSLSNGVRSADESYAYPQFDALYAPGGNFWDNKAAWMKEAPGFNLDRVRTPLMLTGSQNFSWATGSPAMIILDMEFFVGLKMLDRPVDYLYFPGGEHVLRKPRQRFVARQNTVDWMMFWLRGLEDPDPAKARQYVRWRKLRMN